jgi:hypothetical protein
MSPILSVLFQLNVLLYGLMFEELTVIEKLVYPEVEFYLLVILKGEGSLV